MSNNKQVDVIVVGAGPSGIACALTIARGGNKVLVVEKASDFGTKNMFGGAVYLESIKRLFPNSYLEAPYDRFVVKHNYMILSGNNALNVSYENGSSEKNTATITRFAFDGWLAKKAMEEGVYFAPNTLVVDVIKKGNKVVGVKTENEEIYSDAVVLAEGFNSLLANKIGLKKKTEPKHAVLAVKETIRLSSEIINQRFNLKNNEGSMYEIFGGLKNNENPPFAMGILYTFKNTVSIGVGISMEDLTKSGVAPYVYLEKLKSNEHVKSLIEGGEVIEYSAHSIPEGGFKELPTLYDNGILLVGDCANLVDSVHFEGTNLAIESGMIAGKTLNEAIKRKDFSKRTLKEYKKELYKSFVIGDLKTYRNVVPELLKRKNSVFKYYPEKIDEFFKIWTTADNISKKEKYRKFISSFFKDRSLKELFLDVISFVKCAINAII